MNSDSPCSSKIEGGTAVHEPADHARTTVPGVVRTAPYRGSRVPPYPRLRPTDRATEATDHVPGLAYDLPTIPDKPTTDRLADRLGIDADNLRRLAQREGLDLERLTSGDIDAAEALVRALAHRNCETTR